ncbi:hypothetical protein MTR67_039375 [Solanum verrucosum]|uniref:Uncharacterized protein n=1 Tax=Solanum verrucosum TaxID=315347 RepID=A0AAF0UHT8_SOLVR|nr:hypothetical protein MTR67_039375 [Solanum verrucosum]
MRVVAGGVGKKVRQEERDSRGGAMSVVFSHMSNDSGSLLVVLGYGSGWLTYRLVLAGLSWMLLITLALWRRFIARPKGAMIKGLTTRATIVVSSLGAETLMVYVTSTTIIKVLQAVVTDMLRVVLITYLRQEAMLKAKIATMVTEGLEKDPGELGQEKA